VKCTACAATSLASTTSLVALRCDAEHGCRSTFNAWIRHGLDAQDAPALVVGPDDNFLALRSLASLGICVWSDEWLFWVIVISICHLMFELFAPLATRFLDLACCHSRMFLWKRYARLLVGTYLPHTPSARATGLEPIGIVGATNPPCASAVHRAALQSVRWVDERKRCSLY
jgi:hypothetical protein